MSAFDFFANPALPRPAIDTATALRVANDRYGIDGDVVELGSNQDRNFRISADGRRVLLKFSNAAFGAAELEAQSLAASAVADAGIPAPRCLSAGDGESIVTVESAEGPVRARLLDYVAGEPLSDRGPFGRDEVRRLGTLAARVVRALAPLDHPGLAQRTQWNLRDGHETVRRLAGSIPDAERRRRVVAVTEAAIRALDPLRDGLRTQAIHGDLTDDNVVANPADPDADWGVIDFGDVAESWLVAELAVGCAAVLHHNPRDPLLVLDAVAAFHEVVPLSDAELAALWPIVQLRAATLVASGEHQVALEHDNRYAAQNRTQEWRSFTVAATLDAATMTALIRWRVGDRTRPVDLGDPAALLIDASTAVRLDLSPTSPDLDAGAWLDPDAELRLAGAHPLTVTAWGEPRLTRATVRTTRGAATVPLGIQLSAATTTTVTAPADGTVRRAGDSWVLETHDYELWLDGLDGGASGEVTAGTALGTLAPHPARLSVQVSRTRGDRLPFFVPPALADVGKQVSPDPSPLLGLDPRPTEPTPADLLASRDAHFARVQEHYFAEPPLIERGWREHFVDSEGQTYLDLVNNVATVGHSHPRLVAATSRQWALHNTNSRFHYGAVAEFSRRLAELAPLDAVFLVNSGSEAVDLALRLVTTATGRETIVAMREAYHGWTVGSDAVSSSIGDNPRALETRPSWVRLVDAPNTYRGTHRGPDAGERYLADLGADFARWDAEGLAIAGFIAEPVYGNAGGVLLPDGYLAGAYRMVRERGGLCIADEVQVGYGRLGSYFWGHEQQDAVPDVITIAKAMGNGQPLGAVLTTREIAEAFAAEGSLFSSAGGSPVSCVIGTTVLDIMRDEELVENARVVGAHLKARLEELGRRHPLIGAVHGLGLYLGVELVRSRETLEPATGETAAVCEALLEEGCIVQPTGDHRNVLKIKPPLVITRESADYFVDALDRVLAGIPSS